MKRNLNNVNSEMVKRGAKDLRVYGNPDAWVLVCKASSEQQGWMKSTKAMNIPGCCLIQVTTEFRDPTTNELLACAEAITCVPQVHYNPEIGIFEKI